MATLLKVFFLCLASASVLPTLQADTWIQMQTNEHCSTYKDSLDANKWCLECPDNERMSFLQNPGNGIFYNMNCSAGSVSGEFTRHNTTDNQIKQFQCEQDYVMTAVMKHPAHDANIALTRPYGVKCSKLDGATYEASECYNVSNSRVDDKTGASGFWCNGTDYFTGYYIATTGQMGEMLCCPISDSQASAEVPTDVTIIPMETCLEVDPFYTDCGASCWSGQLNSNYMIRAVKVNGSSVIEVHCQPQENVTLSLIQVNKFVLQLYPFMVCPTNYLLTALWSESHTDQTLKTVKCNLLHPGQQMTHCELFDAEDDLAFCDTANGYYMGGVMLDKHNGITQVMCCHVIEFELMF